MTIAFYCRAKPQGCDAFRIFQQTRRVFLGWPLVRKEPSYDRRALCACIVDPCSASDDEWEREREATGYSPDAKRQFSRNRNFVRRVEEHRQDGAIVLVPRPAEGLAYLGRLTSPFEVVDAPQWGGVLSAPSGHPPFALRSRGRGKPSHRRRCPRLACRWWLSSSCAFAHSWLDSAHVDRSLHLWRVPPSSSPRRWCHSL